MGILRKLLCHLKYGSAGLNAFQMTFQLLRTHSEEIDHMLVLQSAAVTCKAMDEARYVLSAVKLVKMVACCTRASKVMLQNCLQPDEY